MKFYQTDITLPIPYSSSIPLNFSQTAVDGDMNQGEDTETVSKDNFSKPGSEEEQRNGKWLETGK